MEKKVQLKLEAYQKEYETFHKSIQEAKEELKNIELEIEKVKDNVKAEAKTNNKLLSLIKGKNSKTLAELISQKTIAELTLESVLEAQETNQTEVIKAALEYIDAREEENNKIKEEYAEKVREAEELEAKAKELKKKYSYYVFCNLRDSRDMEVARNLKDIIDISGIGWRTNLNEIRNMLKSKDQD